MMRYYVFTDLENTLNTGIEKLNDEAIEIINKLDNKFKFCLVTQASYTDVLHFLECNNLKWNYICEGGAKAYYNGLTYSKKFRLPYNLLLPFVNNIVFLFYQDNITTYAFNYLPYLKSIYPKYSEIINVSRLNDIKHNEFHQMYICIHQSVRNQFVEVMEQHKIDVSLLMEDAKNVFFRLRAKHVNKGYFIKVILEDNNIDFNNTIGFGDSIQDIQIMKNTNKKVAVQNAEPLLKCETTETTSSVNENGVLKYLLNLLYENS